jgi:hypothetical protein
VSTPRAGLSPGPPPEGVKELGSGPSFLVSPAAAVGFAATAALALGSTGAAADEPPPAAQWSVAAHRIHHNDAMTLAAMDADDHRALAPRPGRNLAYIDDELRIERRSGAWAFALLARDQATLVADGQALQLARVIETGQRPDGDMHWRTDASFRAFSGAGIEVRRALALTPQWSIEGSAQLLVLGSWHERKLRGAASYDARSGSFDFDIGSDQLYSRLHFDYEQPKARTGNGLLLGVGARWTDGSTAARIALGDGGWLHWNGVPRQQLSLVANRQGVDSDGFVVYGPLLEGRNRQDGSTRMQPWRAHAALDLSLDGNWRAGAGLDWLPDYGALPYLAALTQLGAAEVGLRWQVHESRLTASLDWRGLSLRLGADRLGSAAHSREAALAWRWQWR